MRVAVPLFQPFQERPEHGNGETSYYNKGEPREQQPAKICHVQPVALAAAVLPVLADDLARETAR